MIKITNFKRIQLLSESIIFLTLISKNVKFRNANDTRRETNKISRDSTVGIAYRVGALLRCGIDFMAHLDIGDADHIPVVLHQ
jgi:hypothetical protein